MKPHLTWALAGVLLALPHAGAGPAPDDRKIVADLDTRYQAAAKVLLAFGSLKTYSPALAPELLSQTAIFT